MKGELTLYFDGSCDNTVQDRVATFGWLLKRGTERLAYGRGLLFSGLGATSNVAEWGALERGLEAALEMRPARLEIRGDSKMVIEQLTGRWRTRALHLRPYRERCRKLLRQMGCFGSARWIPREENVEANALSRLAYREA